MTPTARPNLDNGDVTKQAERDCIFNDDDEGNVVVGFHLGY